MQNSFSFCYPATVGSSIRAQNGYACGAGAVDELLQILITKS